MKYTVEFYENDNGKSEVWDYLEELRAKAPSDKNARIQFKQIALCIQLLQDNRNLLPDNISKHIDDGIWELRPGSNRIFYFFFKNNTYVLLHIFKKKTNKTPRRELDKAKRKRKDYLSRKDAKKNEDMG